MEFVNMSAERKRHMPIKIGHAPSTNKTINIISQNKECSNPERKITSGQGSDNICSPV